MTVDRWTWVSRERAIAHWERVLVTKGLPMISYRAAEEALVTLRGQAEDGVPKREPGEDG